MYLPVPTQKSCAQAWVAASLAVVEAGDEAYDVIIDVDLPTVHAAQDHSVISLVDQFLRDWEQNPISTVTNTIFPQGLYEGYGSPSFYEPVLFMEGKKVPTVSPPSVRLFSRLSRESNKGGQILWVNDSLLPLRWISTGPFRWSRGKIA
jgi:hypothetical protein